MNRKPKRKLSLQELAKAAPLLVALAELLRELHPYVAPWLG